VTNRKNSPKVPGENEAERVLHVLRRNPETALLDSTIAARTGGSLAHVQNVLYHMVRQDVLVERTAPRTYRLKAEQGRVITREETREKMAVVLLARIANQLAVAERARPLGPAAAECLSRITQLQDAERALELIRDKLDSCKLPSAELAAYIGGLPRRLDEAQYEKHALLVRFAMALEVPCPVEPPDFADDDAPPDEHTLQLCLDKITKLKAYSGQLDEALRRRREASDANDRLLKAARIIESALELAQIRMPFSK
jgi:hypothetical protein